MFSTLQIIAATAAFAVAGIAQDASKGHLQAQGPDGTVYIYSINTGNGEGYDYMGVGSLSEADEFELDGGLVVDMSNGMYLNIEMDAYKEKALSTRTTAFPQNGWQIVEGNRLVSDGNYWGLQNEFKSCTDGSGVTTAYIASHETDEQECVSIGGLYFVE